MARHLRRFARQFCAARHAKTESRRRSRLVVQSLEDRTTPATFTVTSAADSGTGTLRDAITTANATVGADTIVFDTRGTFAAPQVISLETPLPTISDNLTINGTGPANLTVQRDPAASNFRVFDVTAPNITLSGFTVTNGVAASDIGGGLRSKGNVTLDTMVFTGNQATGTTGFDTGGGGAIAIEVGSGLLKVVASTISGNTAAKNGGGIFFSYSVSGSLLVQDSTISGNSQTFTGTNQGFYGGGGIFLSGYPSQNPPPGFTPGAFTVSNSTIANNSATGSGGGIFANNVLGGIRVQDSTISGNTSVKTGSVTGPYQTYFYGGGGIGTVFGTPTLVILNSAVSGNVNTGGDPDIQTNYPVNLYSSAVGSPTGFTVSGTSSGNLGFGTNLLLGPLADNGGPTLTMAPQPGSPLIDAGSNVLLPSGTTNDQRGFGFRRTFNGTLDIGAVEVQPLGLPFAISDPTPLTTPGGSTYTFTVTFWDPTGTNNGIRFGTVNNNPAAVVVTDPNGNVVPVTVVDVTPQTDASPLVATYQIDAPGGTWDATDDTTYTLQVGANQVNDEDGNPVPPDLLGPIDIFIPRTLVVTSADDGGPGSLRDAFDKATLGSDDTITFDPTFFNVPRTVSLQTPLPFEGADSGALTIQGPGTDLLTVRRDPSATTDFRVIDSAAPNLTLSSFTITGGTGVAAAAATFGSTTLDHMALTGNTSNGVAGGLYIGDNQDVTVVDSLISGNTAATSVGGILVSPGAHLVLDHSTVSGNTATTGLAGGVLVNANATLDVIDSTISGNTAGTAGGGVFLNTQATLNVINSTLSGNTAAGGPGGGVFGYYFASINVVNSTISGNSATTDGGGLYFFYSGSLTIEGSTISGNQTTASAKGQGGGGIYFYGDPIGDIVIENSTIANNTSAASGGGILLSDFNGLLWLFNSTVSGNTALSTTAGYGGGGVADLGGAGTIAVMNSVVSGNANVNAPDILGTGQVFAYSSLILSPIGFTLAGGSGNLPSGTDPMLGPLQDNGGPTETLAPLAGSPLLDAGDNTLIQPGITTDQRGLDRLFNGTVDIGAVEAQPAAVTIAPAAGQADPTNNNSAVTFTVVFDQPVTGFDASGIDLSGSTPGMGHLVAHITAVSSTTYTVTVTGIAADGTVVAAVNAGTSTVGVNASGQPNLPSPTSASVTVDTTAPAVTINVAAGQNDPTNAAPLQFDVQFSEPVSGFDASDVTLTSSIGDTLTASVVPGIQPNSYVVTVSGMTGSSLVTAAIPVGAASDPAGNASRGSTSTDNTIDYDITPPTVTINQAATQADPAGGVSVSFDVRFSEPVVGFDGSKVDLSAGTAPGTLVATVTGTGPAYTVTVTGMTGSGTVVASIDAGVVTDLAGNFNPSSSGTDNSVTFVHSGVVHLSAASYSVSEVGARQLTITVQRTGGSDGPLTVHYATADGTALAGSDYTAVSGDLQWVAGDTADKTITIPILDDGGLDADSAFAVNLSNISLAGALGTPAIATVTIEEEAAVGFTSSSFSTAESGKGTDVVKQITVSRQFGSHGAVSVDYSVTPGTATAGADYSALATGTLTWADGDTADKTISVTVHDDTFSEGKETINLALSNPTGGALLGTAAATLTIAASNGITIQATATSPQVTLPPDADGNIVTVRLGGKVGSFTYYLTNDAVPISEIDLKDTVPTKSALGITVKKARGATGTATATVGEIDGIGTAGLKSLSLAKADLVGAGIAFNGYVGSVIVGNVLDGADIILNGTATTPRGAPLSTRITAGQIEGDPVTGLTDISVAAPLASLRAVSIGQGTITAPSIGAITVTGKAKTRTTQAISGDLQSNITVAGTGLASTKVPALRSLRVAGTVQGSTISVGGGGGTNGNVGSVSVGAFVDSLLFAGYSGLADGSGTFNLPPATVGSFVVRPPTKAAPDNEFAGSHVIASNFNTVSLGAVDANVTGVKFGFIYHTALKSLTVKTPKFKFDPKLPTPQDLAGTDFEVKKKVV